MSTRSEQVKALTAQLEQGVKDVFHSDNYLNFLRTMAKFHSYSVKPGSREYTSLPPLLISATKKWRIQSPMNRFFVRSP